MKLATVKSEWCILKTLRDNRLHLKKIFSISSLKITFGLPSDEMPYDAVFHPRLQCLPK